MEKPALVIMAAGAGSRFGGLKQITAVDEQGHIIIDFSLYDAWRAGFRDLYFIIKPELESTFREVIGDRMSPYFHITYIHQTLDKLPAGYQVPAGRTKPWGTGHAILCCQGIVDQPFAVINADDYYGPSAFTAMYDYLSSNQEESRYAMIGYQVRNTVTENGSVARGVCEIQDGLLTSVTEHTKIFKNGSDAKYTDDGTTFTDLPGDTIVSMNFWGFTTKMLNELENRFSAFLEKLMDADPCTGEYMLPSVVNEQLQEGIASVQVLPCSETWHGVTYRADLDSVKEAIRLKKQQGIYRENLW